MRTIRPFAGVGAVALLLLGVSGCFNPFAPRLAPTTAIYIPPPTPDSPQNLIRLFEWCWNNRDITVYRQIFTDDFRFVFALGDSAGNLFREDPVTREMELNIANNLFVGGGSAPPASSISLILDPTIVALPDSRPGKNRRWHNEIVTSVNLTIKTEDGAEYRVVGDARFFVVRGDSALIPKELGYGPDSTRWYIERWQDETLQGHSAVAPAGPANPLAAGPSGRTRVSPTAATARRFEMTWGTLNALYAR
jgi:hypothetical protein